MRKKRFSMAVVMLAIMLSLCGCISTGVYKREETDVVRLRSVYLGGCMEDSREVFLSLYIPQSLVCVIRHLDEGTYGSEFLTKRTKEELIETLERDNGLEMVYIDEYIFFRWKTLPGLYWLKKFEEGKKYNTVRLSDMFGMGFAPFPYFLFDAAAEDISEAPVHPKASSFFREGVRYTLQKDEQVFWQIIEAMRVYEVVKNENTYTFILHLENRVWDGIHPGGDNNPACYVNGMPFTITFENGTAIFGYPNE